MCEVGEMDGVVGAVREMRWERGGRDIERGGELAGDCSADAALSDEAADSGGTVPVGVAAVSESTGKESVETRGRCMG